MKIAGKHYTLTLCDECGTILSYANGTGTEYVSSSEKAPLIRIRLLDAAGKKYDLDSAAARVTSVETSGGSYVLHYEKFCGFDIDVKAEIVADGTPFVRWKLGYENRTGHAVEWVNYPGLLLENRTAEKGGAYKTFLPIYEGVEISDFALRDRFSRYWETDYPSKGWEGVYPGPVSLQFMAYYDGSEGLYIGAHDTDFNTKCIDAHREKDGVAFDTKFFPGSDKTSYEYAFPYVTGFFCGDWYAAADIYRDFAERSGMIVQPKLENNPKVPAWIDESPMVVIYPVRGEKDTGDMSPNQYYPYTNALPYLEKLQSETGCKLLSMLCHWEGTAPWCPPYVWPPYGDYENFKEYEKGLHARDMLFGLYCSGIAWTQKSIFTDYNREEQFEKENLKDAMCLAPDGSLPYCVICNDYIRWGYDMCPASPKTVKIMEEEVRKIASGCQSLDYLQLFDQNLGGNASLCYSPDHGHARTPGRGETLAMRSLIDATQRAADAAAEKHVLLGCEAAASEGFTDLLLMNDGRNYQGFMIGCPVPAYEYLYHEYVSTFMGNQNNTFCYLDAAENPDNIFYRTAKFFAQGEMLTVVFKNDGKINWDWGTPWSVVDPDQPRYLAFLKTLNAWRTGAFKKFFLYGRLIRPFAVQCGRYTVKMKEGFSNDLPEVITVAFEYGGRKIQVLVNPFAKEVPFKLVACGKAAAFTLHTADGEKTLDGENPEGVLAPDSVAVLEFC